MGSASEFTSDVMKNSVSPPKLASIMQTMDEFSCATRSMQGEGNLILICFSAGLFHHHGRLVSLGRISDTKSVRFPGSKLAVLCNWNGSGRWHRRRAGLSREGLSGLEERPQIMESAIGEDWTMSGGVRRDQGPFFARALEAPHTCGGGVTVERSRASTCRYARKRDIEPRNPLALLECGGYDGGGAAFDARRRRRLE